jgi:putative transposase
LKKIYSAATAEKAEAELEKFSEIWDSRYPTVSKSWRQNWQYVIPFFEYPKDIRKAIYTTNAIESLNRSLRKVIKTKGAFPNDAAIYKIFFLALEKISKRWTMPIKNWKAALGQFAIKFEDRFPL